MRKLYLFLQHCCKTWAAETICTTGLIISYMVFPVDLFTCCRKHSVWYFVLTDYLLLTPMMHIAQVIMEGLTFRRALAEYQKEALRDMEEYFGVKGLVTKAATVTYKRHNTRVHGAIQAAAAVQSAGGSACLNACMH